MKKRLLSLLLTGALCLSLSAPALAAGLENFQKTNTYTAGQFTDVPAGEWYAANVQAAYELGLMEGSSATTFNPSGNLTIAEALVLACRLHSTYVGDGATFAGSGGAWYQPYVDYAVETAILSPGTYSDYTATATRAQFASILAAALPAEALTAVNSVTALPDVAADAAYAPAVLSLYNAGVLTGSDAAGSFKPDTTIQRSEVATIVTRMADPSLRKTFTLTPAETTQPADDGQITLDDLQGVWSALNYGNDGTILSGREIIIDGDQITDTTHFTDYYEQGTGTITAVETDYTSSSGTTYPVAILWEGQTTEGSTGDTSKFEITEESGVITFDEVGADYFMMDKNSGTRFTKASTALLLQEFQTVVDTVGIKEITTPEDFGYPAYEEFPGVPDFGAIFGVAVDHVEEMDISRRMLTYTYVVDWEGMEPSQKLEEYEQILEECGFEQALRPNMFGQDRLYHVKDEDENDNRDDYMVSSRTSFLYNYDRNRWENLVIIYVQ